MQNKDNLIRPDKVVNEKTTAIVVIQFVDDAGAPVNPASANWTLYDAASGAAINGRTAVTLVTTGATGTIELTPADNVMVDPTKNIEEHRVYVAFTYLGSGTRSGGMDIQIPVVNIKVVS